MSKLKMEVQYLGVFTQKLNQILKDNMILQIYQKKHMNLHQLQKAN